MKGENVKGEGREYVKLLAFRREGICETACILGMIYESLLLNVTESLTAAGQLVVRLLT